MRLNNRIKRALSVLVAVLLLISALPVTALADNSTVITATVKHERTMTILPHPGGELLYVAPTPIYEGDEVSFTATPDEGYVLKSIVWYTDDPTNATDITATKKLTVPHADVTVKVEFAVLCTVSFDMQGHGTQVSPITNVVAGSAISAPTPEPTASGYTFGGWYQEAGCTTAWNFGTDVITENTSLYAKWIENSVPKQAIGGNVTEEGKDAVPNATVELYLGTVKVAATVTDKDGNYQFKEVENGIYNIVVTKEDGKTKTEMVTINDSSATVNVELPVSEINSKVEHKGTEVPDAKSDISKTVVGNLDKVAENHKPEKDGDKVTIKLTVEPRADINTEEQQAIKEEAGDVKKVEFLDLSLLMQTNNEEPVNIGDDNDTLLTIVIPFDFTNVDVTSVMILRNHGGKTEKLTSTQNEDGEYVQINEAAGNITLCVMKFSDYAVAYDTLTEEEEDDGECVRTKTVKLTENGTYGMKLNCKDVGKFTFTKNGSGWNIQNSDGKYLAMKDGKLKLSNEAFAWTYKNGAFSTSVKTEQKNPGYWWGWIYIPGRGSKTVTTTYYLSTVTNGAKLSACSVCTELYKEASGEHEYGCWIDCKDGSHKHVCKYCGKVETEEHKYDETTHKCVCGAYDPACKSVNVSATYKTKTQKHYVGFWPFGYYRNVTTYTATVKVNAEGLKVTKVEVSANQNKGWTKSNTFTSNCKIEQFYVRVTTSDGAKYLFRVVDGIGYPAN